MIEVDGIYAIIAQARGVICVVLVDVGKPLGGRIKALQARRVRPNPQRSIAIFLNIDIGLLGAFLFGSVHRETRSCRIETIEAIFRCSPEPAYVIDEQPIYIIVA